MCFKHSMFVCRHGKRDANNLSTSLAGDATGPVRVCVCVFAYVCVCSSV